MKIILSFFCSAQAIIIIAWNDGPPTDMFNGRVFKQVLSIFITATVLKFGQGIWAVSPWNNIACTSVAEICCGLLWSVMLC
jgi:hypothetical protein